MYDFDWRRTGTTDAAAPGSWQAKSREGPFTEVAVEWSFSKDDLERISWGFVPRRMEDKWYIVKDGDELRFHRSWTGTLCFIAHFKGDAVSRIEISGAFKDTAGEVRLARALLDRLLLGKDAAPC